ncbi:unnamed protein product [Didymodactylos carnosus]|uniref:Uncharacterized protein n=1 Tax=Didymodactylos carnosus TaxID=1234261 RepID=A0A814W3L5_9BILA|nr:unnamed protein product [Didymodactylos carnosus]CAF1207477.1 unnamed protein product [Didymodactylos carnosus]CAF3963433.1 unnamed protein product [Didymodactylos carnosus]CAF4016662.1 unnamed protein product [Didymodactylos carnosus]
MLNSTRINVNKCLSTSIESSLTVNEVSISIPDNTEEKSKKYSTFSCVGNMNRESEWSKRVCRFHNICYDKRLKQFQYYKRPYSAARPILFEAKKGLIYDFNSSGNGFVGILCRMDSVYKGWHPVIVNENLPNDKRMKYLTNVHVIWR